MTHLVFASCSETSMRVLICSEMTPTARKAAHARPAPRPKRLVKEEAIQSVVSTVVVGLGGFGSRTVTGGCCSDEVVVNLGDGGGLGGCELGGGVCEEEEKRGVLVSG